MYEVNSEMAFHIALNAVAQLTHAREVLGDLQRALRAAHESEEVPR